MNKQFICYAIFWLAINILTASFSELSHDEAYYWMYSRFLDWGYFDHPPMVAFMDFVGYSIFPNELGVRLIAVFFTSSTIYILFKLSEYKNTYLFWLIIFACFPLNLFGFMSLPDIPLLFFTALFFLVYKNYIEKDTLQNTLLLSLVMACMLYSKYHGILVIGFTMLSNLSLLKRKSFWLSAFLGACLFLPHLYWQVNHDFPSLKFHLVDRSTKGYELAFTLEYVFGQVIYYGPLIGFFLLFASFKYKAADYFERALKYNLVGIFIFFLLSTLKGSVEANWTISALVPMLILTLRYVSHHPNSERIIIYISIPSILLILLFRIQLVHEVIAIPNDRTAEFRGWKSFTEKIMRAANDTPVTTNSYQLASKLSFYSGKTITALNISESRHNQYDLWHFEDHIKHKNFLFLSSILKHDPRYYSPQMDSLYLFPFDSLPPFKELKLELPLNKLELKQAETIDLRIKIKNTKSFLFNTNFRDDFQPRLWCRGENNDFTFWGDFQSIPSKINTEPFYMTVKFKAPKKVGVYTVYFSLISDKNKIGTCIWDMSEKLELTVK